MLSFECDFCGRRIDDADEFVTVRSLGSRTTCNAKPKRRQWRGGDIAHFHTSYHRCWDKFVEVIDALREHNSDLSEIPVATAQQVRTKRSLHEMPAEVERAIASLRPLGLPNVPRGALARQGLGLEAISKMTDDQLLAIRGVGERTVRRLRDAIREAGL